METVLDELRAIQSQQGDMETSCLCARLKVTRLRIEDEMECYIVVLRMQKAMLLSVIFWGWPKIMLILVTLDACVYQIVKIVTTIGRTGPMVIDGEHTAS